MFLNVNFVYFIIEVEEERGKEVGWGGEKGQETAFRLFTLSMVSLHLKEVLDSSITFAAMNKVFELQELDLVFTRSGFLLIIYLNN